MQVWFSWPWSRACQVSLTALLLVLLLLPLAACGGQASGGLNVSGSTSVAPFAEHLAELYQRQHLGTAVNVQSLGSTALLRRPIARTRFPRH